MTLEDIIKPGFKLTSVPAWARREDISNQEAYSRVKGREVESVRIGRHAFVVERTESSMT